MGANSYTFNNPAIASNQTEVTQQYVPLNGP